MPSKKNPTTFEEVDRHIQKANLSAFQSGGSRRMSAASAKASPAAAIPNVCEIYKIVRPILGLVLNFPIPKKWKDAIKLFMQAMDAICP